MGTTCVSTSIRHREKPGPVVFFGQGRWLTRNLPTGTSCPGSAVVGISRVGATTLDHEILDDTVEVQTVVEPVIDELEEVSSGLWAVLSVQSD